MRHWESLLLRKQLRAAHQELERLQPDLVHVPFVQGHSLVLMGGIAGIARNKNIRILADYHRSDFDDAFSIMSKRERKACLQALGSADTIAVRNVQSLRLFRVIVPRVRIVKLFNPVDTSFFTATRSERIANCGSDLLISFVGLNDARNKGAFVLSDAIPMILQEIPNANFIMAGPDSQGFKSELQRRLGKSASRVVFPGTLARDEIRSLYRQTSVFVFVSYSEAFGNALLEAMSCGTACIGTRVGAIPEILDGGASGLLIDPGDSHQLADAVRRLGRDAELRRRLGKAARERVLSTYDISHFSKVFSNILITTLNSARSA